VSTFLELYEQVGRDFGYTSTTSEWLNKCRQWINSVRSDIKEAKVWSFGKNQTARLQTDVSVTNGIYSLKDTASNVFYSTVLNEMMYDETTNLPVQHEASSASQISDPKRQVTGPPMIWGNAGLDDDGHSLIWLWPIPADTRLIRFEGEKELSDITSADDKRTIDAYFGRLSEWRSCFIAGLDYYARKYNNEDARWVMGSRGIFRSKIKRMAARDRVSGAAAMRLRNVRVVKKMPRGRLDPAHYSNRGRRA
jgi:hypothetical protein